MTEKKTKPAAEQDAAPKKKMGRPSIYSQDLADEICVRLSSGESLRSICRDEHMPAQSQVYVWLNAKKDFAEQYARAREEQADTHADEIIAIADEDPELNPIRDKDGNVIDLKIDSGYVAYQKQRIDARKWTAAKLRPKKYGDRVTHAGDDESPVVLENNMNVFGELLKAIKLQRQTEE
jgi:hypothetical protein